MASKEQKEIIEFELAAEDFHVPEWSSTGVPGFTEFEARFCPGSLDEWHFETEEKCVDCDSVSIMSCLGAETVRRLTENKVTV